MVEAIYTMNRVLCAYLSLPDGTASATGLIAMVTDHYSNLAGSNSERESNDGAGSSRKTQKRVRGNDQPTISRAPDDQSVSHSQIVASDYSFLSTLRTKCSEGSRPCPVRKRTPRFPVSCSYENVNGEKFVSPTRQGLKLRADANGNEVAHEIAMTLADASHTDGSPQVARIPSRRTERVMLSPSRHLQRKTYSWLQHFLEELANTKTSAADMDETDLEGNTDKLSRNKPSTVISLSIDTLRKKARKSKGKKFEVDSNGDNCLVQSEEDKMFGAIRGKPGMDVTHAKIFRRSSMQSQKKKIKKVLFRREEAPSFDALQNLADLSLMMPIENENDSRMQFKDEYDEHGDKLVSLEVLPMNNPKASSKISRTIKASVSNINTVLKILRITSNLSQKHHEERKCCKCLGLIRKPETQPVSLIVSLVNLLALREKFSSCLENPHLRRWCTYEWFDSAIAYPWFSKREFVEYLYHVGLGHVPRLTRVEWGVIRSDIECMPLNPFENMPAILLGRQRIGVDKFF
ncbi:hypothetical protein OROGR_025334 [Orobanche gracilis]